MCISSPTATWLAAAAALMLNPFPQKIAQQINPAFVIFFAKVSNQIGSYFPLFTDLILCSILDSEVDF